MTYTMAAAGDDTKHDSAKNKAWVGAVILAYIVMVAMNAISTSSRLLNNTDNAIISNANPTYVTPDGATFSIWGFIYLFETIAVIYQALPANHDDARLVAGRPLMALAFSLNSIWLLVFAYYLWWLSCAVMLAYLGTLIALYRKLRIHYGGGADDQADVDEGRGVASATVKSLVYTGFSMNMAWIAVASGVNVTVTLRNEGWQTVNGTGGSVQWAIMWAVIFAGVGAFLALTRGDVPYAFTTCWALAGIMRMQTVVNTERFPTADLSSAIADWATAGIVVVAVAAAAGLVKALLETCRRTEEPTPTAGLAVSLSHA